VLFASEACRAMAPVVRPGNVIVPAAGGAAARETASWKRVDWRPLARSDILPTSLHALRLGTPAC